ncbi:hypothetical protein SDC9_85804 [bioreactor metagenome]|uniref:Uncharacterized protein n=1 Tax=bioreactor metagenome TaxID=1076179 RepID=A0A644ZH01_9ZZZZ
MGIMIDDHFKTDEDQNSAQRIFQVIKQIHDAPQCEIERPKSQDRKNIRRVNNKRIGRNREHCRNGVYGKNKIGKLYNEQCQKERGGV